LPAVFSAFASTFCGAIRATISPAIVSTKCTANYSADRRADFATINFPNIAAYFPAICPAFSAAFNWPDHAAIAATLLSA
jgi:hypothetical protein